MCPVQHYVVLGPSERFKLVSYGGLAHATRNAEASSSSAAAAAEPAAKTVKKGKKGKKGKGTKGKGKGKGKKKPAPYKGHEGTYLS